MRMPRCGFFGDLAETDPAARDLVEFPISACLIDGPDGRILFDTGCHPDAMVADGRWPREYQSQFPWSGDDACYLPNRLEQLALGPGDIKRVVLSHLHSDHAGCVEYFGESQVIVHRREFNAALAAHRQKKEDNFYAWRDIAQWSRRDLDWRLIDDHEDELALNDDVTLLNWGPGHSAGMLGLEIALADTGHVILASDAVYTLENYGPPLRPTAFNVNPARALQTVERIRARATTHSAQVWCGHDMFQFRSLVRSTEGWYE